MANDALSSGLRALRFPVSNFQRERLELYIAEIELWNPRLKLVAASGTDLIVRHILDSLAAVPRFTEHTTGMEQPLRLADLGSGAGLPGIPLAIALPDVEVTLVERSGRRAGFLRNAAALLGLPNVDIVESDSFALARKQPGEWTAVTARAFIPLSSELLDSISGLLIEGGVALLYKGRAEVVEQERLLCEQHPRVAAVRVEQIVVPQLEEERHLLVVRFA